MAWALAAVAVGYQINWQVRGIVPMAATLVLVYGAFRTPPTWCRQMGWVAALLLVVSMAVGVWREPQHFALQIELFHLAFVVTVLPTVGLLASRLSQLRLERREQRRALGEALALVQRIAMQDELTGLPNRRHMQQWMGQVLARERRSGQPAALALIDLDHFKRINDVHGHETGDQALIIFAQEARSLLRETDLLARWGGEEFLLGMPDTLPETALLALERLRDRLSDPGTWSACPQARVTFSAGLTQALPGQGLERLLVRADAALYEAKRQGRNRVVQA
jgi:diguanylate cyclase (GGDEF)-like protein